MCVCVWGVSLVSEQLGGLLSPKLGPPHYPHFQCSCNPGLETEEPRGPPWHLLCQTQGFEELMDFEPDSDCCCQVWQEPGEV